MKMSMEMATEDNYIFVIFELDAHSGLYNAIGASMDENFIHDFLDRHHKRLIRIEIFNANEISGPIKTIYYWEDLEEFLKN